MKSDIFHRDEGKMIPENQSLFNDSLLEEVHSGFHLLEEDDSYQVELEVGNLNRENFNIHVSKGILFVTELAQHAGVSDKSNPCKEEDKHLIQQSFVLPENADANHVKASIVNGVLKITLNKTDKTGSTTLQLSSHSGTNQGQVYKKEVFHSRSVNAYKTSGQGFFSGIMRKIRNLFK